MDEKGEKLGILARGLLNDFETCPYTVKNFRDTPSDLLFRFHNVSRLPQGYRPPKIAEDSIISNGDLVVVKGIVACFELTTRGYLSGFLRLKDSGGLYFDGVRDRKWGIDLEFEKLLLKAGSQINLYVIGEAKIPLEEQPYGIEPLVFMMQDYISPIIKR